MNAEEKVKLESELAETIKRRNSYLKHKEDFKITKGKEAVIGFMGRCNSYITVDSFSYLGFICKLIESNELKIKTLLTKLSSEK